MVTKKVGNAGVTLLELIVVITILGILSGGVIISLGLKNSANASGCANILDAKLEQVKTEAMSKNQNAYLVLYKRKDGYYVASTSDMKTFKSDQADGQKLGNNNMEITITMENGIVVDIEDQTIGLRFDRASGAVLPYALVGDSGASEPKAKPSKITITAGGRTSNINIVAQTGKHYVE